jgi:hypothetical protein
MNGEQTLNHNFAECLHTGTYLGKSIVFNVCNDTQTIIPWGGPDWILLVFLCGLGIGVLALLFSLVYWMIYGDSL